MSTINEAHETESDRIEDEDEIDETDNTIDGITWEEVEKAAQVFGHSRVDKVDFGFLMEEAFAVARRGRRHEYETPNLRYWAADAGHTEEVAARALLLAFETSSGLPGDRGEDAPVLQQAYLDLLRAVSVYFLRLESWRVAAYQRLHPQEGGQS